MNLKEAYEKIWQGKMDGIQPPDRQHIDRVTWTAELFSSQVSGPLLDIGTGSGAMLARGIAKGWKVFGIELDNMIARWLGGQGFDVWTLDASKDPVPLPDRSVGVVTMCDVIEHLTDPEFSLLEAKRVLRPGGSIYIATPNCSLWRRILSLAQGVMFRTSGDLYLRDGGHVAYYAPGDLAATLRSAGFAQVEVHLRKSDPCPQNIWNGLAALGATNRSWCEFTYMIASAVRPT
jgi:SAM-dependent methyltransferase